MQPCESGSSDFVNLGQVESLTAARKGALSGNEPSDAIRVVNALLTQIDKVRLMMLSVKETPVPNLSILDGCVFPFRKAL
jgi:hypothetical protein